ncbi:MAG: RluA family pseudouridine synthase [Kiritimatiellae bacterium]|nr:RluA family pseudouridine synthase [Kiritimatiellia bacterium]
MIPHDQHTIEGTGTRLDRFLLNIYPWLDRATVADLLSSGSILLNGRPAKKGAKLTTGDTLDCRAIPEPVDLRLQPNPSLPLAILFEDATLLALDKPAGQPTHPLRFTETDTLANALIARYPDLAAIGGERLFPALLHRLDTQTSGLVLAAKTSVAYAALRAQFRRFAVAKHYTALVHGRVDKPSRLEAPLTHQTRSPCKMAVVKNLAKVKESHRFDATTAWVPIETGQDTSLIDVTIHTGVTHQIRCHLAAAGHPIVGDTLYGSPSFPSTTNHPLSTNPRHWLHASRILLTHPTTGTPPPLPSPPPPTGL